MDVLFNAGVQLPVMPSMEVVGKADSAPPEQIAATGPKVGVSTGDIVTDVVAVVPGHPPIPATV